MKFDLNDILIEPTILSEIESRQTVDVYDENGMLPIFTAPMFDVVDNKNYKSFNDNNIYSIIPRKPSMEYNVNDFYDTNVAKWQAIGLVDFERFFIDSRLEIPEDRKLYILIDMANGHMHRLYKVAKDAKDYYGQKLVLMVGNVANPHTYAAYSNIGVDYVRVSIGSGSGCLTSVQTAVGYPLGSLIHECRELANNLDTPAKIVADGGVSSYSDIIKCLVLGADYVMMGGTLNKAIESASPIYINIGDMYVQPVITEDISHIKTISGLTNYIESLFEIDHANTFFINIFSENGRAGDIHRIGITESNYRKFMVWKRYRGMSTKEVQQELGNKILKTSEGIKKYNKIEYSLSGWVENFIHYLSSTMSYTGFTELQKFIGAPDWNIVSQNTQMRIMK